MRIVNSPVQEYKGGQPYKPAGATNGKCQRQAGSGRNSVRSVAMGLAAAVYAVIRRTLGHRWAGSQPSRSSPAGSPSLLACRSAGGSGSSRSYFHEHTPGSAALQAQNQKCIARSQRNAPASPLTLQSAQADRQVPSPPPLLPRMKPALVLHSPAAAQSAQRSSASKQSSGTSRGSGACCTVSCSGRKGSVWIQNMAAGCRARGG